MKRFGQFLQTVQSTAEQVRSRVDEGINAVSPNRAEYTPAATSDRQPKTKSDVGSISRDQMLQLTVKLSKKNKIFQERLSVAEDKLKVETKGHCTALQLIQDIFREAEGWGMVKRNAHMLITREMQKDLLKQQCQALRKEIETCVQKTNVSTESMAKAKDTFDMETLFLKEEVARMTTKMRDAEVARTDLANTISELRQRNAELARQIRQQQTKAEAQSQMKQSNAHAKEAALQQQLAATKRKLQREVEDRARAQAQKSALEQDLKRERDNTRRKLEEARAGWMQEHQRRAKAWTEESKRAQTTQTQLQTALAAAKRKCAEVSTSLKTVTAEKKTAMESLQQKLQQINAKSTRAVAAMQKQIRELKTSKAELKDSLASTESKLKMASMQLEQADQSVARLREENKGHEQNTETALAKDSALRGQVADAQRQIRTLQNRDKLLQEECERYKKQYSEACKRVSTLQEASATASRTHQEEITAEREQAEQRHTEAISALTKQHQADIAQIRAEESSVRAEALQQAVSARDRDHEAATKAAAEQHSYALKVREQQLQEQLESKQQATDRVREQLSSLQQLQEQQKKREEERHEEWETARLTFLEVQTSLQQKLLEAESRCAASESALDKLTAEKIESDSKAAHAASLELKVSHTEDELAKVNRRCTELQKSLSEGKALASAAAEEQNTLSTQLALKEQQVSKERRLYNELQAETKRQNAEHEQQLVGLRLQLKSERTNSAEKEKAHKKEKETLNASLQRCRDRNIEKVTLVEQLKGQLEEALSKRELEETREQLRREKAATEERSVQVKTLSRRLAEAEDRAEASAVEADDLRDRINALDHKMRKIGEKLKATSSELEAVKEQRLKAEELAKSLESDKKELLDTIKDLRAELEAATESVEALKEELKTCRAEFARDRGKAQDTRETLEHTIEKLREDMQRRARAATDMIQGKDKEIAALQDQISALKADIQSGAPGERRILGLAKTQAERDLQIKKLAKELQRVTKTCIWMRKELISSRESEKSLKARVKSLSNNRSAEDMNMEYVKNAIVRFMRFAAEMEQDQMIKLIPVIASLLNFSKAEQKAVMMPFSR